MAVAAMTIVEDDAASVDRRRRLTLTKATSGT